ncbi:hypothetical protein [Rhodococcus jostii]|nr:hypothetical protein [Rhodococcus jostii]
MTSAATPAAGYREGFLILGGVMVVGAIVSVLLINPDRDSATNSR